MKTTVKSAAIFLISVFAVLSYIFAGCASVYKPDDRDDIFREATAWFESQTSRYEIITGEEVDGRVVFLTGTKNPGTDDYQFLQAFVVDKTKTDGFEVSAWSDGQRGVSAGFSTYVLDSGDLTIIFGDTTDSIFDFVNARRIDVEFTEARVSFADRKNETLKITGNAPYILVIEGGYQVQDVEFISGDLIVKYSDFYSDDLMENSETLDTSHVFE